MHTCLCTGHANAHYSLGVLLDKERKDFQAAAREYRETIRINAEHADAHHDLGDLLYGPHVQTFVPDALTCVPMRLLSCLQTCAQTCIH